MVSRGGPADAEALEKLGGKHEVSGVKFTVKVILA
jgi:hypothetical protein